MIELPESLLPHLACFARALGMLAVLPWGEGNLHHDKKCILALLLTLVSVPHLEPSTQYSALGLPLEFLFGVLLGYPVALLSDAAAFAGELLDAARGQSQAQFYSPTSGVLPIMGSVTQQGVWAALLAAGALPQLLLSFVATLGQSAATLDAAHWGWVMRVLVLNFTGVSLALLPILTLFVLIDLAAGFVGKVAPQLSLAGEVFICKSVTAGLLLVHLIPAVPFGAVLPPLLLPLTNR